MPSWIRIRIRIQQLKLMRVPIRNPESLYGLTCGAAQAPGGAGQRGTGGGRATPKLHPEVKLLREGVDISQRIVYAKYKLMSD